MLIRLSPSTLTRPANTTAYAQNDLIASSATAGSIVVPSFTLLGSAFPVFLRRIILRTNKTSGLTAATFLVDFWSAAPTFTNGDNGAYAVATGTSSWLGTATTGAMAQAADGAFVSIEVNLGIKSTGNEVYWSLKSADASSFTPISSQTFTLVAEIFG